MIKKLRINEAESDYIRIGNRLIPRNASAFGYSDYDTISRETRRKKDAEDAAAKRAEEERIAAEKEAEAKRIAAEKGAGLYSAFSDIVKDADFTNEDTFSKIDDLLIPSSGMADTQAGEIMRAIQRLRYRDYNDGDVFWSGYGIKTCLGSAAFIASISDYFEELLNEMADHDSSWPGYSDALTNLAIDIVKYLLDNPDLFSEPPAGDSRDWDSDWAEEIDEKAYSYEYDVSLRYIQEYDYGGGNGPDDWDIEFFLEDICRNFERARLEHPYSDYYVITNLSDEDYKELEDHFDKWFEDWAQEYYEEYDEEDEDEDDWEEDEE